MAKENVIHNLECESSCPEKRDDAVIWSVDDKIYLFSGRINNKIYGDFWVYHTNDNHWQQLDETSPSARWGSSFVETRDGELYMLGGQEQDSSLLSNDFWVYTQKSETVTTTPTSILNTDNSTLTAVYGICIAILVLTLFSSVLLAASFYVYKNRQKEVIKIGEDRPSNEIDLKVTL